MYERSSIYAAGILAILTLALICPPNFAQAESIVGFTQYNSRLQIDAIPTSQQMSVVTLSVSHGLSAELTLHVDQIPEDSADLKITKSMPKVYFPLKYFHTVAYFPYEQVIKVPGLDGCVDDPDSCLACPTCGWTFDSTETIEDSQGFCVRKSLDDLAKGLRWRGEELLANAATACNPLSTAHCLRQGELLYDGYEICEGFRDYEINVEVTGDEIYTFTLSPSSPLYRTDDIPGISGIESTIRARLIGDTQPYQGLPDLGNYILYIPSAPANHEYVRNSQENMLLLPREELSRDGSEFDKVGISFYKFRMMGSHARVTSAGDGLHNQLFQKHQQDIASLIHHPSTDTQWLLQGKKPYKNSMLFLAGQEKRLDANIPEINHSLISITSTATDVAETDVESQACLVQAWAESFTSMSKNGTVHVQIRNDGNEKANYIVTVGDCNFNLIDAIPAQAVSLDIGHETQLHFDVYTNYNINTTNVCWVRLWSPRHRLYDELELVFDTFKYPQSPSWDMTGHNEGSQIDDSAPDLDDTEPPVIKLNGSSPLIMLHNLPYVELGATVSDNCDDNLTATINTNGLDTSTPGIYTVTYDATDAAGNIAEQITRDVFVWDPFGPFDLNNDSKINAADFDKFLQAFATCEGQQNHNPEADYDGDHCVTLIDYQYWLTYYQYINPLPNGDPPPAPTEVLGDADNDFDVDLKDIGALQECATGPDAGPVTSSCKWADFDSDGDVDADDKAIFLGCNSGPNHALDLACKYTHPKKTTKQENQLE